MPSVDELSRRRADQLLDRCDYLLGRLEALLLPPSRPALTIVHDETEEADDAR